jgi:hypothetical protein
MNSYADRFDQSRYADDPPVRVFDYDYADGSEVWIPERVWRRLVTIGSAYELHYLPMLGGGSEVRTWDAVQAQTIGDELSFVAEVVKDSLLLHWLEALSPIVESAARRGGSPALGVEGP